MSNPWSSDFDPPSVLDTDRVHLESLGPEHTDLDLGALSGSREHLIQSMHWGPLFDGGFSRDDDVREMTRHRGEFERREAYAYAGLEPGDGNKYIACVYINPSSGSVQQPATQLTYWVIEDEVPTNLDSHLFTSLMEWLQNDWPFETVVVPFYEENERGIKHAAEMGLTKNDQRDDEGRIVFEWRRS